MKGPFKESDMQIDEPNMTCISHVEEQERSPETANYDSTETTKNAVTAATTSLEMLDAVDGEERIPEDMHEAGDDGDGGGQDHQPQQAPPPLTGELLPLAGELSKFSEPVLTCMVQVLMKKCNPPQEKFPMLGKNPKPAPWWPTGNEPWWAELGEGAAPPSYKRAHHLSAADKVVAIVAMIKNIAPDFARLTLSMQMAKSVTNIITAAEADIWDTAIVHERERYMQAHAGGPEPTATVPLFRADKPAPKKKKVPDGQADANPVEKKRRKMKPSLVITGKEGGYVLKWPPMSKNNAAAESTAGASSSTAAVEGIGAPRSEREAGDDIYGTVNNSAEDPPCPIPFPLCRGDEVLVMHDDRGSATIEGHSDTAQPNKGYSALFYEYELTPDGYKPLARNEQKDGGTEGSSANYNDHETSGSSKNHGTSLVLQTNTGIHIASSSQNQCSTGLFHPAGAATENPQKGSNDIAGGSCSYTTAQDAGGSSWNPTIVVQHNTALHNDNRSGGNNLNHDHSGVLQPNTAALSPTTYNDPDTAMIPSDGYPEIPTDPHRGCDSIFMVSNNNTMQESALTHYGVTLGDHGIGGDNINNETALNTVPSAEPYSWHGDILMGGDDNSPSALDKWFENEYLNEQMGIQNYLDQPDANRDNTR